MQKWVFTILSAVCVWWAMWLLLTWLGDLVGPPNWVAIPLALAVLFRGAAQR